MDTYYPALDRRSELPEQLAGQRDAVFSTFPDICRFHREYAPQHLHIPSCKLNSTRQTKFALV